MPCFTDMVDFLDEDAHVASPQSGLWSSILPNAPRNEVESDGIDWKYTNITVKCNDEPADMNSYCEGLLTYTGTTGPESFSGSCEGTHLAVTSTLICKGIGNHTSSKAGPFGKKESSDECTGTKTFEPIVMEIKDQKLHGYSHSCTGSTSYQSELLLSESTVADQGTMVEPTNLQV